MLNALWKALTQVFPSTFMCILHPKLESGLDTWLDLWTSASSVHPQIVLQAAQKEIKSRGRRSLAVLREISVAQKRTVIWNVDYPHLCFHAE